MSIEWSEPDMVRLENLSATPGMAKVGAVLAHVVENMLAPALAGRRVQSCLHILDHLYVNPPMLAVGGAREVEQRALICPMHPDRLLCNMPKCLDMHLRSRHQRDAFEARCFVCEAPMLDPISGELRDDFEGVTARVQLHQRVPFYDDNRARNQWFMYAGDLWTLPVAYLCPRHSELLELPLTMAWPTSMAGVTPEDVAR